MNKIAVIEQLPIITEQIKEIGKNLDKRLADLKLDKLVCSEESRKSIKNLRTELGNELKEFEEQRKNIKKKINEPYDAFNKTYEEEIKVKYQNADLILKNKIDIVETEIKNKAKVLIVDFFEEHKKSKACLKENYIKFDELNIQIELDALTEKGLLAKKYKDAIIEKVDNVERDIETINTMEHNDEILVEYLKHKNLSLAIKEVNDRHVILDQVQRDYEIVQEKQKQEEQVIKKAETILKAPTPESEEIYTLTFKVRATKRKLSELKRFLVDGGYDYE